MTADYSQIELRVMAHLSEDAGLIEAFTSGEDLHTTVASQVFGVGKDAVDAEMRRKIKAMSYGLAYGLSAFGLSQQLNIDPAEARVLMDTYFERFGGVRELTSCTGSWRRPGPPVTRRRSCCRRYLPDLNSDNRQRREAAERMALNAPIQGTAADIVKVAMLRVDKALRGGGADLADALQVHDEIVLEIAKGERKRGGGYGAPRDGERGQAARPARCVGRRRHGLGVGRALNGPVPQVTGARNRVPVPGPRSCAATPGRPGPSSGLLLR
ncbi:hypothetical protein SCALM49S_07239 [Streptomyces californicus]